MSWPNDAVRHSISRRLLLSAHGLGGQPDQRTEPAQLAVTAQPRGSPLRTLRRGHSSCRPSFAPRWRIRLGVNPAGDGATRRCLLPLVGVVPLPRSRRGPKCRSRTIQNGPTEHRGRAAAGAPDRGSGVTQRKLLAWNGSGTAEPSVRAAFVDEYGIVPVPGSNLNYSLLERVDAEALR